MVYRGCQSWPRRSFTAAAFGRVAVLAAIESGRFLLDCLGRGEPVGFGVRDTSCQIGATPQSVGHRRPIAIIGMRAGQTCIQGLQFFAEPPKGRLRLALTAIARPKAAAQKAARGDV